MLFAGDVLFRGSIGRTDLERGDYATLINNITKKLLILPDETVVYPGHGPATTIGVEKSSNPYL
ncbi:Hydroxyacylglutathione hydrolase GloC [bioreactor metagenome]|uniref:Hydroxyacylglutathione hydrolase GloC n=1 Tax=bioreactor metagenome TaxID=1076179 RepID=A0A645FYQ8_9ZZZZ